MLKEFIVTPRAHTLFRVLAELCALRGWFKDQ